MHHFMISQSDEAIPAFLAEALDEMDVGILLLDRDMRVRFLNRRQFEILALPPECLAPGVTFRDLLNHAGSHGRFAIAPADLPEFIDRREAAVRGGSVAPA